MIDRERGSVQRGDQAGGGDVASEAGAVADGGIGRWSAQSICERRMREVANRREAKRINANSAPPEATGTPIVMPRIKGVSRVRTMEQAQLSLFQLERQGHFSGYPLTPESEYPTLLTRLPIFVPAKRSHQRERIDMDNALPFSTPWGEGRKHGPPLTVFDEDTLIALGRMRQRLLVGCPQNLPIPVSEPYRRGPDANVHVHVVQCMISDIQEMIGTSCGGKNNELRLDSIRRLNATVIEFVTNPSTAHVRHGSAVKLIDVNWTEYKDAALLYIQFSPVMARWFETEYTYIDWDLRRKLTDTGKAVHRFLAGQSKTYEISTHKLMTTIGYMRPHNKFLVDLRDSMDQLKAEGWVRQHGITGTGRRTLCKLRIDRS